MTMNYQNVMPQNNVIGNDYSVDESLGYKEEVKGILESYQGQGVNLVTDFMKVVSSPHTKEEFINSVCESLTTSSIFTDPAIANEAFYNNYTERVHQLIDNSIHDIVKESAMLLSLIHI